MIDDYSTLRSCMSLLAPFFNKAIVASTLFTAAAQCSADLPRWGQKDEHGHHIPNAIKLLLHYYTESTMHGCKWWNIRVYKCKLTELVNSINISVAGDELLHHTLHRQPSSQYQSCGAIVHSGIQICRPCPDQNLKRKAERRYKNICQEYKPTHTYELSSFENAKGKPLPSALNPKPHLITIQKANCSLPGRHPEHQLPQRHVEVCDPCCPVHWHQLQHPTGV